MNKADSYRKSTDALWVLAPLASQHQRGQTRLRVFTVVHHCAAHYCIFTVNTPTPDTHRLPPHMHALYKHCTSACWVMLTGCAGCLSENFLISLRRGVLGQWARARFLFTQAISCIHVSYLCPKWDVLAFFLIPFFSPESFGHAKF